MDEIPVGQSTKNNQFTEEQEPFEIIAPDADKPLEERLVSKTWSTRNDAFKEICEMFKQAEQNCANDTFKEYASKWTTFLTDGHPTSLDKALEAY